MGFFQLPDQNKSVVRLAYSQRFASRVLAAFAHIRMKGRKISTTITALVLLLVTVLRLLPAKPASAAWFNDEYSYRQTISFTHDTDITSDRRVTITIDTATLITAGKMQSDCDDSRFTDLNGKLLRYQLTGTCNNSATTYDVVFNKVFNGENQAFFYYGNPAAVSASDSTVASVTAEGLP